MAYSIRFSASAPVLDSRIFRANSAYVVLPMAPSGMPDVYSILCNYVSLRLR